MKKTTLFLFIVLIITTSLLSCSSESYEDKLLGKWVCASGGQIIMYEFEKDTEGNYTATCATSVSGSSPDIYMFDEYSASGKVITFKQDGKQTKSNYSIEDGYLYIDGLEFEVAE